VCGLIGGAVDVEPHLNTISHRGPDDQGIVRCGDWTLGHTRLAIQGSTRQPLTDPLPLTYNGELWNPGRLRARIADHAWQTSSGDTEPVAVAIARGGIEALRDLDGMFALAWVDPTTGSLHLARDPYGEVPLHYGETADGSFVYSSEIKSLLSLGAIPSSVRWLPPGHAATVEPGGKLTLVRWFEEPSPSEMSLRELLAVGVTDRLTSDAPVALLMSGGLDSSAVASLAGAGFPAYTAVHHPRSLDRRHAREVAASLGVGLIEVPIPTPTADDLSRVVEHIEMPHKAQVEIGWACLHLARRMKADGVRVVLSGEGADELLGSYGGIAYHGIRQRGWDGYRRDAFTGQHRKNFARTNKVFMACGVEARLPFLDPHLVSTVLAMTQDEVTLNGRHPKAVLAAAFAADIGEASAWRAKAAFQTSARIDRSAAAVIDGNPTSFYRSSFRTRFMEVKP